MTEKEMAELGAVTLQAFLNKFSEPNKQLVDNLTNSEVIAIVLEELMIASIRDIVQKGESESARE